MAGRSFYLRPYLYRGVLVGVVGFVVVVGVLCGGCLRRKIVKVQKVAVRILPALLTVVAVVYFNGVAGDLDIHAQGLRDSGTRWGDAAINIALTPPASPLACTAIGELIGLSERAAALTGALALIDVDSRPEAAALAAAEIRALQRRASALPGGVELARALRDLADALDGYAEGGSSALGDVREASARNARARAYLYQQKSICGGV
jgi:hypothetical protein